MIARGNSAQEKCAFRNLGKLVWILPAGPGGGENQQKHCYRRGRSSTMNTIVVSAAALRHGRATCVLICSLPSCACPCQRALRSQTQGEVSMSGQVILYFEDQADALRFALAAGSVMAGDGTRATDDLVQETTRVTRIKLDAANKGATGKNKQPPNPNPSGRVA